MATDYSIQEEELKKELSDLKRELHMKGVRALSNKQSRLAKMAVQRKQIDLLQNQIKELEPIVSTLYSSHHHLRDNQMKGYLIYLLQLKEYYTREVETKRQIICEREEQIKKLVRELCAMRNEYAKKKRTIPRKAPEFVLVENMSNRMNQIEKRICSLQHENKVIRESIMSLQSFLRQYKKFEKEFHEKIGDMTDEAQMHLDRAVSSYEEREECINRRNIYQDRCSQDLRKAAINENALNIIMEKTQKFENFGDLQKKRRSDSRIATTGELIEQGITGLEPELNIGQDLHSALVASSGRATPEEMDEHFKLTDDQANSKFSYLEELLEMIHREQNTIDELKEKNRELLMGLSNHERRQRWEIREAQSKAKETKAEADAAAASVTEARSELDNLLGKLRSLHLKCGSKEMTTPYQEQKEEADISETPQVQEKEDEDIDDSNALEFNEKVEKNILQSLMLVEYIRMKESVQEETQPKLIDVDEDEPIIAEPSKAEYLDIIQPRQLKSQPDLSCILDMHGEETFLPLDQLKSKAVAAVTEIESGEGTEDDDSLAIRKDKKKA